MSHMRNVTENGGILLQRTSVTTTWWKRAVKDLCRNGNSIGDWTASSPASRPFPHHCHISLDQHSLQDLRLRTSTALDVSTLFRTLHYVVFGWFSLRFPSPLCLHQKHLPIGPLAPSCSPIPGGSQSTFSRYWPLSLTMDTGMEIEPNPPSQKRPIMDDDLPAPSKSTKLSSSTLTYAVPTANRFTPLASSSSSPSGYYT